MKKIVLLMVLMLALATTASAQSGLEGIVFIGEEEFSFIMEKGAGGYYQAKDQYFEALDGSSISFNVTTNIDPFISYGLTATNVTANPVNFGLVIPVFNITPIGSGSVTASISGGVTDATGNGVAIDPLLGDNIQLNQTDNAVWGVGGPFAVGPPPGSYTYPPAFFAGVFPGPHTVFGELVAFSLTGDFDVASLTGYCSIATPIPGGLVLVGSGLLLLVGLRRKN
jgi:opacity protein-like surface antigen